MGDCGSRGERQNRCLVRSASLPFAALLLLGWASACAQLSGLADLGIGNVDGGVVVPGTDGSAGGPGDGAQPGADSSSPADDAATTDAPTSVPDGSDSGGTPKPCSGTAGPALVQVGAFCIDATEVTNDNYAAFLAASPTTSLAPSPACSYKSNFTPSASWPATPNKATNPVVYVDWCDAYAYCAWAGKHLCGAVGGGASSKAAVADKTIDEWYIACSKDGANVYPYGGNTYQQGACNDSESLAKGTRPVASFTGCEGGYTGIFDMNGNAYEWEDACDVSAGASDSCIIRGGSWNFSGAQYGGCNTYFNDYVVERSNTFNDTGFRCCSN